ncbi:hypothetical protein ANN_20214 [Periplaneta americana]|uniref:Uncharacterized protein n=1 Tax=Periplaneta americana TaxID=6978 RepID=A0ABQ8SCQ6_PERAM|nr:hypothetical protein ANN_20214 [Periplaneta americana]
MRQKYDFCGFVFLKPVHVQNGPLPPQYTPNNNVQQSDIPTGLLLMEYHYMHVQSELSVPLVFVVLWRTLCPLELPIGRSLEGLNAEIEAGTLQHFLFVLFISGSSLFSAWTSLGMSEVLIKKIRREGVCAGDEKLESPGKNRPRELLILVDDMNRCILRRKIQEFYTVQKEVPTLKKLLKVPGEAIISKVGEKRYGKLRFSYDDLRRTNIADDSNRQRSSSEVASSPANFVFASKANADDVRRAQRRSLTFIAVKKPCTFKSTGQNSSDDRRRRSS